MNLNMYQCFNKKMLEMINLTSADSKPLVTPDDFFPKLSSLRSSFCNRNLANKSKFVYEIKPTNTEHS